MELFHGGCHGYTMQDKKGLSYCTGCQYFEADWRLPYLNDETIKEQKRMTRIRTEAKYGLKQIK